nr:11010_t:CDS:10 [Entrophospora candida]
MDDKTSHRLVLNEFTLYETKTIDRTTPTDPTELNVIDDDVIYSKQEITDILTVLDEGNRISGGLHKVVTAYGIVGFIRFTEGYYISLITEKSPVALIGGHYIYHIDNTVLRPIGPNTRVEKKSDEQRPENHRKFSYNEMFVWNHYLLENGFRSLKKDSDWILPIINGFVDQSKISIFGRNIFVTLIARRSRYFAGARFLKRGVNDQGYVANDVETEQIVSEMSTTSFNHSGNRSCNNPNYTSYVQHRGSIPLYWSQDVANMIPKPPITLNFRDPFYSAAALHFDNMFQRYGAPIIVLNLIKTKEKNRRESILGDELEESINYLTQFLPENSLKYKAWDMSKARKGDEDVMDLMETFAEEYLADTGFFHSGPEASINVIKREEIQGVPQNQRMHLRQNGVVRTNCIDCLDRTNAAQLIIGKCALGHQLYALGIIDQPKVHVDSDVVNMLTDMYHDHGDTIAFQYGGSNLVNTIDSYRKINQWTSHSRDLIENLRRFYSNSFQDRDKQDAMNLFLGHYPQRDQDLPALWDLTNDYKLHFMDPPRFRRARRSYINWWTSDALNQKDGQHDIARYQVVSRLSRQFDEEEDSDKGYWIEYYGPRSITSFEKLFAFTMNSTTKYIPTSANLSTYDYSPFTVRVNPQGTKDIHSLIESIVEKSLNPSVSSSEAKEYKQYISQIKNISLTSTPTSDTDPSLTSHSEYHHYANYVKRANLPNPITDLNIPADEKVYYDYLEVPKKCAILQAAGSNHYANSGVKSRYQAYEAWLKTGKLIVSNNNSKNKINTVNSLIISGNGSGSSIIVGNKDGGLVVSSNNNSIQNRSNSNNNFDQMRKELYKINEVA